MKQATLILIIMLILFSILGCKSIFHVEFEDHIHSNDNEVTNNDNGLNIENVPTEQFTIELDLVSGEYRAIWKEGYEYDTPILLNNSNDLKDFLKARRCLANWSWSHYCELLSISNLSKRSFYEKEAINSKWSVRE